MKPVLRTRQIGLQPHYSRHPLAPMEIVYECEKPPGFWARLVGLSAIKKVTLALTIAGVLFYGYLIAAVAIQFVTEGLPDGFWPAVGILTMLYLAAYALRRR